MACGGALCHLMAHLGRNNVHSVDACDQGRLGPGFRRERHKGRSLVCGLVQEVRLDDQSEAVASHLSVGSAKCAACNMTPLVARECPGMHMHARDRALLFGGTDRHDRRASTHAGTAHLVPSMYTSILNGRFVWKLGRMPVIYIIVDFWAHDSLHVDPKGEH